MYHLLTPSSIATNQSESADTSKYGSACSPARPSLSSGPMGSPGMLASAAGDRGGGERRRRRRQGATRPGDSSMERLVLWFLHGTETRERKPKLTPRSRTRCWPPRSSYPRPGPVGGNGPGDSRVSKLAKENQQHFRVGFSNIKKASTRNWIQIVDVSVKMLLNPTQTKTWCGHEFAACANLENTQPRQARCLYSEV